MVKYSFCPKCGGELENKNAFYKCTSCEYNFFPHSAITACILPIESDMVMLNHRAFEPQKGKVDFLGGFLNYGEDPKEGIAREAKEEIGSEIEILDLLTVNIDSYRYQNEDVATLNFIYVGKVKKGKIKVADDVADVFWHPINKLPNNLGFESLKTAYKKLQKWHEKNKL